MTQQHPSHLPSGLTATVRVVEAILGRVVAGAEGKDLYGVVECVRRDMVPFREASDSAERQEALDHARQRLDPLPVEQKTKLARAYTLYLELVNVCENAYRTHRLRERMQDREDSDARAAVTFVLTAHPTESRSPENIRLLRRVQDHLVERLEAGRDVNDREVENLLHVAWRVRTHPEEKPSPEDEANHLFSLMTDPILAELVDLDRVGHEVRIRAWVGGDKDGHPGVGPDQTEAALNLSRSRFLAFVESALLPPVRDDAVLAGGDAVLDALADLENALTDLERVVAGDGGRVADLREAIDAFQSAYRDRLGVEHPKVARLSTLLKIFPALVVPLELREERDRYAPDEPIADMMRRLAEIAEGGAIEEYARACFGGPADRRRRLRRAGDPGPPALRAAGRPRAHPGDPVGRMGGRCVSGRGRAAWLPRGQVRLAGNGRADGNARQPCRLHDAMRAIGEWCEARGLKPLFFHGHGGSVGRGGGRIEELAAT